MKILLVAEGATLAHVARPLVLAEECTRLGHDVVLAAPTRYAWAFADAAFEVRPLDAQSPEIFASRLAAGDPLYDLATLDSYVDIDRALIRSVRPDLIVGDFRLSLCVSARLENVAYTSLSNAYWSPHYAHPGAWPVPDLPLTRFLPISVAAWLFNKVRPIAFAQHAKPMNALRKRHGLSDLGGNLQAVYTDADAVCYCDVPSLFALKGAPASHRIVGPLIWSPPGSPPQWWDDLPSGKPVAYLSLGSSGRADLAAPAARALVAAGFVVMLSTAGAAADIDVPDVFHARLLPGLDACRRADIVVCNGGSPTTQQALAAGRPVLGIASNLDQFLNMQALTNGGVGALHRADRFDAGALARLAKGLLANDAARQRAGRIAREMSVLTPAAVAGNVLNQR